MIFGTDAGVDEREAVFCGGIEGREGPAEAEDPCPAEMVLGSPEMVEGPAEVGASPACAARKAASLSRVVDAAWVGLLLAGDLVA